jgi:hypothetical protein
VSQTAAFFDTRITETEGALDVLEIEASNTGMKRLAAVVLAVAVMLPAPVLAQDGQTRVDGSKNTSPVSLKRIKRALQEAQAQPPSNRLRLSYYVAVVGESQPIDLFKDFDTTHGAVPFTAPSHQELFDQVTPREFRAPSADLLGAAMWLGTKLAKKVSDNRKK